MRKTSINKYVCSNKKYVMMIIIFSVLSSLADTSIGFSLQKLILLVENMSGRSVFEFILYASGGITLYIVFYSLFAYAQRNLLKNINISIKKDLFEAIIGKDYINFTEKNSARYISILNNDLSNLENNYFKNIPTFIMDIFLIVVGIMAIMYLSIPLAAIVFVSSGILVISSAILGKKVEARSEKLYEKMEDYNVKLKDLLEGFEVIKSYQANKYVQAILGKHITNLEGARYKVKAIENPSNGFLYGMTMFILIIQMLCGAYFVYAGKVGIGALLSLSIFATSVSDALRDITDCVIAMYSTKSNIRKIDEVLEESKVDAVTSQGEVINELFPMEIHDVSFKYSGANEYVFKNINFKFEKGKKYAVVGQSGVGKSTFIKLLMQYFTYEGEIKCHGVELSKIDRESYYDKISVIHQKSFVFEDTILNNITMYQDYDKNDIEKVIMQAGLENICNNEADGINTVIKEQGQNFSGGEAQRIAIARALLRKSDMIILDEATSNLDKVLASRINKIVLSNKDITVISITHDISELTLSEYDEIIVMGENGIVETGSYRELINKHKYFYELVNKDWLANTVLPAGARGI